MKGYIGGLIRMTGLNAGRATETVRTNVQDVGHTAPHPIHREETVTVQTPPSQTHRNSPWQEIPSGPVPDMNQLQGNHEPGHRDIPNAATQNSTESSTPLPTQDTITINPLTRYTIPPLHRQSPRVFQDSPDSPTPAKPPFTSSLPATIETRQIREQATDQTATVSETPHRTIILPETTDTLQNRQIRGQIRCQKNKIKTPTTTNRGNQTEFAEIREIRGQTHNTNKTNPPTGSNELTEVREIKEIRGQTNIMTNIISGNPENSNSLSSHPSALPTEDTSLADHSAAEPVPGKVAPPIPQGTPVITLEDIRQYVAESESPQGEPHSPPPIGHNSMEHITSAPAAQPQKPVQTKQPEPIETQQFNLSIGSINLTVEAPEPQMQTIPPLRPEPNRHASFSGETANTRWGRNYIRIK